MVKWNKNIRFTRMERFYLQALRVGKIFAKLKKIFYLHCARKTVSYLQGPHFDRFSRVRLGFAIDLLEQAHFA